MAPTATRAAVSRALARSRTLRMSLVPVLHAPARSACPGRGLVTAARWRRRLRRRLGARHRALPVLPVLVRDEQGDGAARRATAADARQDFGSIRLDRHPPAPAVAALAAPQLAGDGLRIDRHACRHPFENCHERLPMRFASGEKSQHPAAILYELSAASGPRGSSRARGIADAQSGTDAPKTTDFTPVPSTRSRMIRARPYLCTAWWP